MIAYELENHFALVSVRGRVALVDKDAAIRRSMVDPETILRFVPSLIWLDRCNVDSISLAELEQGKVLWQRPDPKYRLWDCGDQYIATRDGDGDYAPVGHIAGNLWRDPADFGRYNAHGIVMWASAWLDPDAVRARCQAAIKQGTLIWEAP